MSCGDVCQRKPEDVAKDAIIKGDMEQLNNALIDFDEPKALTRLLAAALESGNGKERDLVAILLKHNAPPNSKDDDNTPLKLAMERGLTDCVEVLIKNGANPKMVTSTQNNGLHCTILGVNSNFTDERNAISSMTKLLNVTNITLNKKNRSGITPIHLAIKFKLWDIVEFLIGKGANIDITCGEKTSREFINEVGPEKIKNLIKDMPVNVEKSADLFTLLTEMLMKKQESGFIAEVTRSSDMFDEIKDERNVESTLLQLAILNDLDQAVALLVDNEADLNLHTATNIHLPIFIAVERENEKIVSLILQSPKCDLSNALNKHERTPLHMAAIQNTNSKCTDLLVKNAASCNLNINAQDFRDNTALHYAAMHNKQSIVDSLLKGNANIFVTDYENIPAFFHIKPKVVNEFLDEKITTTGTISSDDYTLCFNFDFLVNECFGRTDAENPSAIVHKGAEVQHLEMIADSPEHRQLLQHPVIKCFLHLKWYRICWFFYLNFLIYLLYMTSLSLHVYFITVSSNCSSNGTLTEQNTFNRGTFLWFATLICLIIIAIREIFQLTIGICNYFNQLENWLEIALIILTGILLFCPSNNTQLLQSVSAFVILLAFTELVLLAGRHPILSSYVKMFFRVLTSFMQLLLWYSIFIFGFGFAFYIVFRHCDSENFFYDLLTAIFKTTIMVTGEFEAGELKFDSLAITSHIIFILFLFFIAIVLLNLLTGLAVSDTQAIRNESELYSCIAQVRLYAQLESLLLGGTFYGNLCHRLSSYILLMNSLQDDKYILEIKLNKGNKMVPDLRGCSRDCRDILGIFCIGKCTCLRKLCKWCLVFNTILKDARIIVEQKQELSEIGRLRQELSEIKNKLDEVLRPRSRIGGGNA